MDRQLIIFSWRSIRWQLLTSSWSRNIHINFYYAIVLLMPCNMLYGALQ